MERFLLNRLLAYCIFICFFTTLLTSCSTHVSHRDGPPNFYVDETKIPNAVPKAEPLAKYGNMPSYVVFGKRYYTMKSSHHYDAVGVASWYGMQFHSHRTSSGEPYNLVGMTAAHKTLPLPTYVEVTNLKNHKKIVVKVNDRGPFESNRLIDLSYVAAKKLGMLGHGTTLVRVQAIDPLAYNKKPSEPILAHHSKPIDHHSFSPDTTNFVYLQVGAFRDRQKAERLQQRLVALLAAPVNISHSPTHSSSLYRVKIGPIKDTVSANHITNRLKGLGIHSNKILGAE